MCVRELNDLPSFKTITVCLLIKQSYRKHVILYLLLFDLGVFTAPLKGAYMFRISVFGVGGISTTATIVKNGERVVIAHDIQPSAQDRLNSSNGVVLILEVGDVVYVRLWSGMRIYDSQHNYNTFSGFLLFPLR